ncbi:HDOD domain-containing protein [Gemmatimonas sp.]|uniref:EAL and HDOD domain-containing protein n=1 Tax=Gemmatimonas sp. TaxID=1962908 RepID=UPI0025BDA92A|nr:HDOD domain-containing protein [Gemmatimonas sp.]MCA2989703.1 HDOD domain-containing protein [Gemmatimonas sp.]
MPSSSVDETPRTAVQQVFVARQPIFDVQDTRVAYELLYRATREATHAHEGAPSQTLLCGDTALHSMLSIGLERLTGGTTAFVNMTEAHLLGGLYKIFEPRTVVLELLETVDGTPEVVAACEAAVAAGYTLALDDYDGRASLDVLLPFATIVKVDVLNRDLRALAPMIRGLLGRGLVVLAERVESREVLATAREIGCTLFQGYVYSRPETLDGRTVNVHQAAVFQIMALLNKPETPEAALDEAFRSHPSLSLSLLRMVNSASFGGRGVDSIPYALRVVGREALSRWMLVMLAVSVSSRSAVAHEAVLQALVRGRFCELITARNATGDPGARFLVGLLSRMDALLGLPMDQVLDRLPVSNEVRAALLERTGIHASTLRLADAYQNGEWAVVDALGGDAALSGLYAESVLWAHDRLSPGTPS